VEPFLLVASEVREALGAGRPVVALETSAVARGLPPPWGLAALLRHLATATEGRSRDSNLALLEENARVAGAVAAALAAGGGP